MLRKQRAPLGVLAVVASAKLPNTPVPSVKIFFISGLCTILCEPIMFSVRIKIADVIARKCERRIMDTFYIRSRQSFHVTSIVYIRWAADSTALP